LQIILSNDLIVVGVVFPFFPADKNELMTKLEQVTLGFAAALCAVAAAASETISYSYDTRGRLVKVVRSGSVSNNVTANYSYDKADNRTSVNLTSPNVTPP
jgi:YD repeat-containing protein